MIIKREARQKHQNSKQCTVFTYDFGEKKISISVADIQGRYPDEGYVINEEVTEMFYVENGLGKIVIDEEEHKLAPQDVVLIHPGQKFYYDGNLRVVITCAPVWYIEQYKESKQK